MKFVITLEDAVDIALVVLVLIGLAICIAVNWTRERKKKGGGKS